MLKKLCTVSQELRELLHDHAIEVVACEYVNKAISESKENEGHKLCVFVGHYLGFLANLITMSPDVKLPQAVLTMVLNQTSLVNYILTSSCECNPDSDYERTSLNSLIHVPLMVLLYNSTCNSAELRSLLFQHPHGIALVKFMFKSICQHREDMKGQQDAEDPENEQVLEWFDRLMVKLVANRDSESQPESKSSFCLPVLHAI